MGSNVFANGREISAKADGNKSIAAMADVCLSPPSPPAGPLPLPYPNFSEASDTADGSKTVKIGGQEVGLKNKSTYKKSKGNEAATRSFGMGVVTHTIQGKTQHAAWSFDVKIEGENAIRHMDLTTHNHGSDPFNMALTTDVGKVELIGTGSKECKELEQKNQDKREEMGQEKSSTTVTHANYTPANGPTQQLWSCSSPIAACYKKSTPGYCQGLGFKYSRRARQKKDRRKKRDVYYSKARGYESALKAALFHDNVPVSVYDSLIASVHKNLPAVYRYYDLRKRKMVLPDIHQYDTYVPILSDLDKRHTWDQAVAAVVDSLAPLGDEYCRELQRGMTTARWCDRFPNQGKQSGAFSSGSYDGQPYILMNYQPDVLDHVFTLAHEAGHSMHSWYSAKTQPYQYYNYTIFVAEVASTFNEQLLARHLMEKAKTKGERAYLINRQIDGIRGTIIRQTMFAEFEKLIHALVESGEPLTVDALRREYRKLLDLYFGPAFTIDPELELECLRIPHFYRAFYVYKYATGLSAAIALSERVTTGGQKELDAYLGFLKGGSSKWPLDLLRDAGVDMEKPTPVNTALKEFDRLVTELDDLL